MVLEDVIPQSYALVAVVTAKSKKHKTWTIMKPNGNISTLQFVHVKTLTSTILFPKVFQWNTGTGTQTAKHISFIIHRPHGTLVFPDAENTFEQTPMWTLFLTNNPAKISSAMYIKT